ncbi:ATP-binding protein [Actinorugispora endophytica]|nr:ATP-binding protein [Actinorugispora endophytica]
MRDDDFFPIRAARTFPGTADRCGEARAWIRGLLHPFPHARDAVELVASELFANAVRHTASGEPGGEIEVTLTLSGEDPETLRLEVVDQGPGNSVPKQAARAILPGADAQNGRGLFIASILSRAWGRFPADHRRSGLERGHPDSMVTWAEFCTHRDMEMAGNP